MQKAGHFKGGPSASSGGKVKDVADLRSPFVPWEKLLFFVWLLESREMITGSKWFCSEICFWFTVNHSQEVRS